MVFVPIQTVAASERTVVNRKSTEHCNAIDLNNIDNLLVGVILNTICHYVVPFKVSIWLHGHMCMCYTQVIVQLFKTILRFLTTV